MPKGQAKGKMRIEMAARWAAIELATFLKLPMIETVEFDVTKTIDPKRPANVHTFSYHVDPVSFWIHIVLEGEQYLPISALIQDSRSGHCKSRYFSFVYSPNLEFTRIEELPEQNDRFWTLTMSFRK